MSVFGKFEGVVGVDDLMDVSIGVLKSDKLALQGEARNLVMLYGSVTK